MADTDRQVIELNKVLQEAIDIYIDRIEGRLKISDLAQKYGLSERTIHNRIATAREFYAKELEKAGDKLRADLWQKYEKLERELQARWESSGDPAYAAQLRGVYADMRRMISLDKAPKAAVDSQGNVIPQSLVIVMDDSKYKKIEEEYRKKSEIIEGKFTEKIEEE